MQLVTKYYTFLQGLLDILRGALLTPQYFMI